MRRKPPNGMNIKEIEAKKKDARNAEKMGGNGINYIKVFR